jgi:hypothetical protein
MNFKKKCERDSLSPSRGSPLEPPLQNGFSFLPSEGSGVGTRATPEGGGNARKINNLFFGFLFSIKNKIQTRISTNRIIYFYQKIFRERISEA